MRGNRRRSGRTGSGHHDDRTDPRRDRQLCRQAERVLGMALCELDDPLLAQLILLGVHARGGGTLGAELLAPSGTDRETLLHMRVRLEGVRGWLRSELARAVNRRRAPEIVFQLDVQPGPAREGGAS